MWALVHRLCTAIEHLCLHPVQVLSADEVAWVDAYHAEVYSKVSPRLSGDALDWLRTNTAPLEVPAAMALA